MKTKGRHSGSSLNEEEESVFYPGLLAVLIGCAFWVPPNICHGSKWLDLVGIVLVGIGTGAVTSALNQFIQRRIKQRQQQEFFGRLVKDKWTREVCYQYANDRQTMLPMPQCIGHEVELHYEGGVTIRVVANYGVMHGIVESLVEFTGDSRLVGEGVYIYTSGVLHNDEQADGLAHSGKYTIHLFHEREPDRIRVFYQGMIPDPMARGYEIWKRTTG